MSTPLERYDGSAWTLPGLVAPPPATVPVAGAFSDNQTFSDFTLGVGTSAVGTVGKVLPVVYAGSGKTVTGWEMVPDSSTKAATVPTQAQGGTNALQLMAQGGNSASPLSGVDWSAFSLIGTHQPPTTATPNGHLYNGMRLGHCVAPYLHDIFVRGIPGNSGAPPGETFSINFYYCTNGLIDSCQVDGRNDAGTQVSASNIGFNNSDHCTVSNTISQYGGPGLCFTAYMCTNTTLTDNDFRFGRISLNFERCGGGFIHITRCDLRGQTSSNGHIWVNSDVSSAQVVITDPIVDAWPVRVQVKQTYAGNPQKQLVSDIQLIVAGVDQTANPAYLKVLQSP